MAEITSYVWLGQATLMLVIWRPDAEVDQVTCGGVPTAAAVHEDLGAGSGAMPFLPRTWPYRRL